jgi:hypothetical protein
MFYVREKLDVVMRKEATIVSKSDKEIQYLWT